VVFFFMFRTEGALDPVDELATADPRDGAAASDDPADTALQGPVPPPCPGTDDDVRH
jgi:hypothetical protein